MPCPPPEDLPIPGIKPEAPVAPTLQVYSFTTELPGSPKFNRSKAYCRDTERERDRERVGLLMRQRCLALLAGRGKWQPTPIFLPGESCGQRSLVGCCPWGHTGLDMTEETYQGYMHWRRKWQPLQYSCLENPRDGGAWWAAVYGVTQSWTRLKRLSSSSSTPS